MSHRKSTVRDKLRWLRVAWRARPPTVLFPILMLFPGLTATILGDQVSRAFTDIAGGVVIRGIGSAFVIGGVLAVVSVLRSDRSLEVIGYVFTALGCALFGAGAVLGLGLLGVMSGSVNIAVAVVLTDLVRRLVKEAKARER